MKFSLKNFTFTFTFRKVKLKKRKKKNGYLEILRHLTFTVAAKNLGCGKIINKHKKLKTRK